MLATFKIMKEEMKCNNCDWSGRYPGTTDFRIREIKSHWRIDPPVLITDEDTPFFRDKEFTSFHLYSFARMVESHRRLGTFTSYQDIFDEWDKRGRTDY